MIIMIMFIMMLKRMIMINMTMMKMIMMLITITLTMNMIMMKRIMTINMLMMTMNRVKRNYIFKWNCKVGVCASDKKDIHHSRPDTGALQCALPPGNDFTGVSCPFQINFIENAFLGRIQIYEYIYMWFFCFIFFFKCNTFGSLRANNLLGYCRTLQQ